MFWFNPFLFGTLSYLTHFVFLLSHFSLTRAAAHDPRKCVMQNIVVFKKTGKNSHGCLVDIDSANFNAPRFNPSSLQCYSVLSTIA